MKQFLTVFRFELLGFIKNKVYLISTLIICLVAAIGLSLPNFVDLFGED